MSRDITGRKAVVTGAASGIGVAAVARLLADGCEVLAVDLVGDGLAGTHNQVADLTDQGAIMEVAAMARSALGGLDILINNAGHGRTDEYTMEGYSEVIDVNLNASVELCYAFHPVLRAQGGTIVNLGSCASFIAIGHAPAYTASKAGLMGFTRAVADQWARDGIRVNLVAPGFIETRMTSNVRNDDQKAEKLKRATPHGDLAGRTKWQWPCSSSPRRSHLILPGRALSSMAG